ncbi:hypothetical protein DV096_14340 [Bradymonadaceae bacterium TMQ3]|nr:hypothetical protein DV096_14340 [Bradymonadaceae bacterium TMQ3]TXC74899.1 hypothetical protein FRC91_15225 [Bradymonadales bacterium TMQ1]
MLNSRALLTLCAVLSLTLIPLGCSDDVTDTDTDIPADSGDPNDSGNPNDSGTPDATPDDSGTPDADADDSGTPDADTGPTNPTEPVEDPDRFACAGEYQLICDEVCTSPKVDPDNCGGCGNVCGENEACSGGFCMQECRPGENICDRACVDFQTDNNNCGGCGIACGEGEGCVESACVPALTFDEPDFCAGGGPPIRFDEVDGDLCAGDVAEETFRWAMCTCSDSRFTAGLTTDAFDSREGPYLPGSLGGSVGSNGDFNTNSFVDIGGSVWLGPNGSMGFNAAQNTIRGELHVGGPDATSSALTTVNEDAFIARSIGGSIAIDKRLTIPQSGIIGGGVSYNDLVRAPVSVPDPCGCAEDERVPVEALVAQRSTFNDNDVIGLQPNALMGSNYNRLELPCGQYYLDGISVGGELVIHATGRTALFIGGDVDAGRLVIKAAPDAELDVFIDGAINASGMELGSANYPANTRFYISGDRLQITSDVLVGGFIYAYPGRIQIVDDVEIFGGLFANEIQITAPVAIHYDRQVQRSGDVCEIPVVDPDPDPDPADPNPDAGDTDPDPDAGDTDPNPDAGDTDPEPEPVCSSLDEACSSSGDCCAPLSCEEGFCGTAACRTTTQPCVYNSDCCSGMCARSGDSGICIVG